MKTCYDLSRRVTLPIRGSLARRRRLHGRSGSGNSDLHRCVSREVRFEEAAGALGEDSLKQFIRNMVPVAIVLAGVILLLLGLIELASR